MGGKSFRRHGKVVWPGYTEITPRHVIQVGRNDACPCGSGKKYKQCHEREGSVYLEKLAAEVDRERLRERREEMKRQGVPWYKRLLVR
jgi:hypothetical protein